MEALNEVLPVVIYFLLIILIIVVIILGIKAIITLSKLDDVIDDVGNKMKSLDKVFSMVDLVTNRFSIVTDAIVGFATSIVKKLFKSKNNDEEEEDYE